MSGTFKIRIDVLVQPGGRVGPCRCSSVGRLAASIRPRSRASADCRPAFPPQTVDPLRSSESCSSVMKLASLDGRHAADNELDRSHSLSASLQRCHWAVQNQPPRRTQEEPGIAARDRPRTAGESLVGLVVDADCFGRCGDLPEASYRGRSSVISCDIPAMSPISPSGNPSPPNGPMNGDVSRPHVYGVSISSSNLRSRISIVEPIVLKNSHGSLAP